MEKSDIPLYVCIDGPSVLTLFCDECDKTIGTWEGTTTLDKLNVAAERHCMEAHILLEMVGSTPGKHAPPRRRSQSGTGIEGKNSIR